MERRAWTLVWDAEEYLYPLGIFQAETDAQAARAAVLDRLVAEGMAEERDEEAGDLPLDESKVRAYFEEKLSLERWSSLPLFLTDEYGSSDRDVERLEGELRDYLDAGEEIQEARWSSYVETAREELVEQGARP
jgi:hypothetical protein